MNRDAPFFVRDIETRSTVDLKKVGLHNYAMHPTTEVLCLGCCIGDEPIELWRPGNPVPKAYVDTMRRKRPAVAHNAPFEMAIERNILNPRYGFPIIPVEQNVCTMAIANALALPASLSKLAKVLGLEQQKDTVGNRLMLQMTKPRKPRKSEDPNGIYWFDDEERRHNLGIYCIKDVGTAREAANVMPWLSDDEYQIWLLDQKINNCGIYIDQELALAARKIIEATEPYIDNELRKITQGQVSGITQVAKLKAWLGQYIEVESLDKASIENWLNQDLPEHVLRALELRYLGAQAATKKVEALLAHRNGTGRVYDAFVYHAAGPGRWSSRGIQLHNLKRSITADIEKAVEIIGQGDFDAARAAYDNPLSVIGDLIRAMIVAAPGHQLIGADFSGIEARVTAWLASEKRKLDIFRTFDDGQGPDPYLVAAAAVLNLDLADLIKRYDADERLAREQRQIGKACELAFGYQGGVNAFRKFARWELEKGISKDMLIFMTLRKLKPTGDPEMDLESITNEIQKVKDAWRKAHPNIVTMWRDLNAAMWQATRQPNRKVRYRNSLTFEHDGSTLWITLPSGRRLSYPEARIRRIIRPKDSGLVIVSMKGEPALIFKDNTSGMWRDTVVYGGLVTENCVQAIARDLLAQAMLRLDAAGLKIVAHVHDEAICEVPSSKVKKLLPAFRRLMVAVPDWAEGLPIVAKAWSSSRYVK